MTYSKKTLFATAAILIFGAAPAYADGHGENMHHADKVHADMMKKDHMSMDEKLAKWNAMSSADRKMKLQNMSVEEHQKWMMMTDAEKKMYKATLSAEEMAIFKTSMKRHKAMHHSKADMKAAIKADMTDAEKAAWPTMSEEARNAWMKEKKEMYMAKHGMTHKGMKKTMMAPSKINDTIGEVLQADGQPDPQMDNEIIMSQGGTAKLGVVEMKETDGMVKNNAIVVPTVNSNVATTVSCPVGTTAQPDMTCMVTGDYEAAVVTTGAADMTMKSNTMMKTDTTTWTAPSYSQGEYKGTLRPDTVVINNVN